MLQQHTENVYKNFIIIKTMTFSEILEHFKNHEFVRRECWPENNAIKLANGNDEISLFKVFKDNIYLPINSVYSLLPICEDDDYSSNIKNKLSIKDIVADDWDVFDESKAKECGFLLRNLNRATDRQLMALMAINKIKKDFEAMPYEEKLELHEKYPDLIVTC